MLITLCLLLGSAGAIYLACEYFVNGVEWFGQKLKLGATATGTVLAAFGTALPESAVTFVAVIYGKTAEARAVFDQLNARSKLVYVPAYDIALVCVGLGWKDQALEYLSQAYQERSGWMTYLNVDPRLDPLRSDSRFIDLLRRIRLA